MTGISLYGSLFLSAFLSATLLPGSSEILLASYVTLEQGNIWGLVAVATFGNLAGSIINWILGRFLGRFKDRRWFPLSEKLYDKSVYWFGRYGRWTLLLAWMPVIGDPLTIVAGMFKVPFTAFVLLVGIGKLARYLFVLQAALFLTP